MMTGPLKVLGELDGYLQAIVRYVECRLLFSGITSSQGITLSSHQNIKRYFKGIVRNVEQAIDPDLFSVQPRIADVKEPEKFLKQLKKKRSYLLHLAEGIPSRANKHFKALQIGTNERAITEALTGIHCVGLLPEDFEIMKQFNNVTPADMYFGRRKEILQERNQIKEQTMALRRQQYYQAVGV